jgi:Flp pilus assembly protein TadB
MDILALLTPLGAAFAWMWHELNKAKKEATQQAISEAEREKSYSERLEARLKARETDLEKALLDLMNLRLNSQDPEDILRSIIEADHGISWAEKDGKIIAGRYGTEGRTFKWLEYTIGIGYD